MTTHEIRMGADIGGTFTDVVLEGAGPRVSAKAPTTPAAPEDGIVEGMRRVCARAGIAPAQIGHIVHGTTLAANALIERRGAKTAFVTTEGFRDVIEMRTESRFEHYDLNLELPEPLVPRNRRHTVPERMDARGDVLIPLARGAVEDLARRLRDAAYESVAIGLLHAYANDAHERLIAEVLAERLPGVMLSLSSQVSPQMREYERFSTTVANAYVKPLMAAYLRRLRGRLAEEGADCPVHLIHSGGGIMSLESGVEFPVRLVESGPAGGAVFAADIAARHGLDKVLGFDMGGTTAKICLLEAQTPRTARVFEVARLHRFKKGSGMPLSIPAIEMVEIGAGGGSLAHVDAMRQIRVGPESAGADPGPACYGHGGARPAVTDADLILGKLDADGFAGGSIALDRGAAERALETHVGAPLGMNAAEAARGVAEVVDETMANAARVHAVENGQDPGAYTMIAFGGAAPLHAARLCEKLGIARCLVPPGAGVGSAIGFLRAPFGFEAVKSVFMPLSDFDTEAARGIFADLRAQASGFVAACAPEAGIATECKLYMRYAGQGWDIPVSLPSGLAEAPKADAILALFEAAYARLFSRIVDGMAVEIAVWAATAATRVPPPDRVRETARRPAQAQGPARALFDPVLGRNVRARIVRRGDLAPGDHLDGPALVTERETTAVAPSGWRVAALADGTLDIRRAEERA